MPTSDLVTVSGERTTECFGCTWSVPRIRTPSGPQAGKTGRGGTTLRRQVSGGTPSVPVPRGGVEDFIYVLDSRRERGEVTVHVCTLSFRPLRQTSWGVVEGRGSFRLHGQVSVMSLKVVKDPN